MDCYGKSVIGNRKLDVFNTVDLRLLDFGFQNWTGRIGDIDFSFDKLPKTARGPGESDINLNVALRFLLEGFPSQLRNRIYSARSVDRHDLCLREKIYRRQ